MSIAPKRTPYLFDEADWKMRRLNKDGTLLEPVPAVRDSAAIRDSAVVKDSTLVQNTR
jgi:hypothetical protein